MLIENVFMTCRREEIITNKNDLTRNDDGAAVYGMNMKQL